MKVLQINVDRTKLAQELVFQTAASEKVDVILISEPNKTRLKKSRTWYVDEAESCCIVRRNPRNKVLEWGKGRGFVWVKLPGITVYSVYISPNVAEADYESFLNDMEESTRGNGERLIVGGDFNAKSPLWGGALEDRRGTLLAEWAASMNWIPVNSGDTPTFQRGGSQSFIDITFVTGNTLRDVGAWTVLEEETGSLHRYIIYEVYCGEERRRQPWGSRQKFCPAKFCDILDRNRDKFRQLMDSKSLTEALGKWQKEATEHVRTDVRGNAVYWWTEEIQALRAAALSSRRSLTRSMAHRATAAVINLLREEYKAARKLLRKTILQSKARCWRKLCDDLEADIWGEGFKIMMRSLKQFAPRVDLDRERMADIAGVLFPAVDRVSWNDIQLVDSQLEHITKEELLSAADRLKSNRAPGLDYILPETVKLVAKKQTSKLLEILNELLQNGRFPTEWKVGKLVLAPKPGKDLREANGFRPICLLNTLGKLYEAIILGRLDRELSEKGPLHDLQYGFRKGRSAIDTIGEVISTIKSAGANRLRALILVDVKNAFNSADWKNIVHSLIQRGISGGTVRVICDYLQTRKLQVCPGHIREVNMGVPQGSILGPTLWNVLYDGILAINPVAGTKLVAYADDLAIVIVAASKQELEYKSNVMLARVDHWLADHQLELAPEKTEMVCFTMARLDNLRIRVRGVDIHPCKSVKYLGVVIDRHLNFGAHIASVCDKAERTAGAVIRLMSNVSGPSTSKRHALAQVVYSTLLYAAPVWAEGLKINKNSNRLGAVQRKVALRVARAYRTVSTEAVLVIAGQIPIQLLVDERRRVQASVQDKRVAKKDERAITLGKWQKLFNSSPKGRWTAKLIRNIEAWRDRAHGETNYFLTQFLSGHGSFMSYLERIGKSAETACMHCGEPDTAEHTVFFCPRFIELRSAMERSVGVVPTIENIIAIALRDRESWNSTLGIVTRVMKIKENEMRSLSNP